MTDKAHDGMGGDSFEVEDGGVIILRSGGRIHAHTGSKILLDDGIVLPKTSGIG